MQNANYIYFLYNPDTRLFYYVENDLVKQQGSPKMLEFAPGGWQDLSITNARNATYFGLDRSFTVPLDFYETAGLIAKEVFYSSGTEGRVLLIIMEQKLFFDNAFYGFYYDKFYKGELDLSKFVHAGVKATANIMEGGFPKMLKDNESTTYEFKVKESTAPRIYNDGVLLKQKATYIVTNGDGTDINYYTGGHTLLLILVSTEELNSFGAVSEKRVKTRNFIGDLWATGERFINPGVDPTTATLSWDFKFTPKLSVGISPINPTRMILQLHVLTSDSLGQTYPIDEVPAHDPAFLYNHEHRMKGTFVVNVPPNARLVLYMTANQNRDFTVFEYSNDTGDFTVDYDFRKEATMIRGFDWFDMYDKLISKMTNGSYSVSSSILQKPDLKVMLTSVDCIRLFDEALVKISWKYFWGLINTVFDAALYVVGNVVHLEEKESSIDWNDYVDVGQLSDVKITPAIDYMPNYIKLGYPNEKYDNVNGRQEFNTTQEYKTPITKIAKTLEFVGNIRTDCYGIEFLRITLDGKPTTDSDSSGQLFAIHVKSATQAFVNEQGINEDVYPLDRILNPYATGLLSPLTVYNLALSPKQCFFRKENYFKSIFYWLDTRKITYQTQDKNADVIVSAPGKRIVEERADAMISDFSHRYFLPVMVEGTAPCPVNFIQAIEDNPKKTIRFNIDGFYYKGLPVKVGAEPESNKEQTFQMLFAPDTDFENLKRYFG